MSKSNPFRNACLILAVAGIVAVILFGVLGYGRADGSGFSDVRYWRASTGLWLEGGNPYDPAQISRYAVSIGYDAIAQYAYPPTALWLGLPLSGMSPVASGWMWTCLNLLALIGIVAGCARLLSLLSGRAATVAEIALITAVMAGSPYTANVVWTGQTALVISCLLIWCWLLTYSGRSILAGMLLGLAFAKPQLVLLPALWLLFDRQWKVLFAAGVTAAVVSAIPLMETGLDTLHAWLRATTAYMNDPSPALLLSHNLNLASIAKAFEWPGHQQLGMVFMLAGVVLTAIIHRQLKDQPQGQVIALGLLVPLSLLCFYGRDYDLAACGPLLALAMFAAQRSTADLMFAIMLVGCLNIPHRLVERIEPVYLIYWRPIMVLVGIIWLVAWAYSQGQRPRPVPAT